MHTQLEPFAAGPGPAIRLFPRQLYHNKSTQSEKDGRGGGRIRVQRDIFFFFPYIAKEEKKDTVALLE